MVIIGELPFQFVEGEGFRAYSLALGPSFEHPYRHTVARDYTKTSIEDKRKLLAQARRLYLHWFAFYSHPDPRLSTLDKPWLSHLGTSCILCDDDSLETLNHLFFRYVTWASTRWRGKHVINAAYRELLASLVYHIWMERNRRRFENVRRDARALSNTILDDVKQRIIYIELPFSVSLCGLYRLWRIP
ncbi:UNVERIFIED_CONTAM: hypothetical protein Sindi_2689800 [Sesamum indicum]